MEEEIIFDDESLLYEKVYSAYNDMHDHMHHFLESPYNYPQEVVDEVLDIIDRLEVLSQKLSDIEFKGSFRY